MDVASTGTGPPDCVWVQIYYKGQEEEEKFGDAIKIKPIPDDVNDLKKVVFPEKSVVEIAAVKVYASGTTVPIPDGTDNLPAWNKVSSYTTTGEEPLIVIAPKPQAQRQQQDGKLRCCSRMAFLYSICY
jgi:hypothetical protein